MVSTSVSTPRGTWPPLSCTQRSTESEAPLRTARPDGRSTPDMRVWAVNATNSQPCTVISSSSARSLSVRPSVASSTIERPSGVSSLSELR